MKFKKEDINNILNHYQYYIKNYAFDFLNEFHRSNLIWGRSLYMEFIYDRTSNFIKERIKE